jgi:hypothetical protein
MDSQHLKYLIVLVCFVAYSYSEPTGKAQKSLSFFNVVRFPNDVCLGSGNRNGTCYTAEECETRAGTASGTCADAFGVCCIIQLTCGESSSENCTYIVQASTTSPTESFCQYNICPASNDICRIRFDFTVFDIAGPATTAVLTAAVAVTLGGAIGDCVDDSFVVTSSGRTGSPLICGINTGQHIFVDASKECSKAAFTFGALAATRQYDIKVTQYDCKNEMGGPPGCLQYLTANAGNIASFNYPIGAAAVTSTAANSVTHLSNQHYDICFRRSDDFCAVCFSPSISISVVADNTQTASSSFGLSGSADAAAPETNIDVACSTDYLIIPQATTPVIAIMHGIATIGSAERICGRVFSYTQDQTLVIAYAPAAFLSVCTGKRPFRITFKTDSNEANVGAADGTTNEAVDFPGGIIGFSLNYRQVAC